MKILNKTATLEELYLEYWPKIKNGQRASDILLLEVVLPFPEYKLIWISSPRDYVFFNLNQHHELSLYAHNCFEDLRGKCNIENVIRKDCRRVLSDQTFLYCMLNSLGPFGKSGGEIEHINIAGRGFGYLIKKNHVEKVKKNFEDQLTIFQDSAVKRLDDDIDLSIGGELIESLDEDIYKLIGSPMSRMSKNDILSAYKKIKHIDGDELESFIFNVDARMYLRPRISFAPLRHGIEASKVEFSDAIALIYDFRRKIAVKKCSYTYLKDQLRLLMSFGAMGYFFPRGVESRITFDFWNAVAPYDHLLSFNPDKSE